MQDPREAPAPTLPASGTRVDPPIAAFIDGVPLTWDDLLPALAEAAGGTILRETVLDRLLERELADRHLTVTPDQVTAERAELARSVAESTSADPQQVERLLQTVRSQRGLGDVRFRGLLERTARLRALVQDQVVVTDEEIDQAFEIAHGPKYRCRVLVVPSEREAHDHLETLRGLADIPAGFARLAAEYSRDPSAQRGGLLEPISAADPAYPAALRAEVARLSPGALSGVIVLDRGFAIALLDSVTPPTGVARADAEPALREDLRRRNERLAMDALAADLLRRATVSVADRSLRWSWEQLPPP